MPALYLQETSSGRIRPLPVQEEASLYVCGITPYDATHIGHAATYVAFDLLNRAWRDAGAAVAYVQNVTDVDDPLLERAIRDGVDWQDLSAEQTQLFRVDMEALNVLAPDHYIGAVESIGWIVPQIEKLVAAGLAYAAAGSAGSEGSEGSEGSAVEPEGDIYFSVEAASARGLGETSERPDANDGAWWLGQISGLSPEQMLPVFAERGGDPDRPGKRHPLDPLLWRVAREGEPSWDGGSLGAGRPGWHIECTVISQRFLPEPFTVQGGGSDLIFPHHEMGAGHAYSLSGVPMARHYAHTGMVGLDGQKMSKSRGNLVLVSKLRRDGVDPASIRLAILAHHYRSDWSWTDEVLEQAQTRLARWRSALESTPPGSAEILVAGIRAALSQDLDAPRALAAVDLWADEAARQTGHSSEEAALVRDAVEALLGIVLG